MKSVGEVMAMGRTFQESFQKALRGLETGAYGLDEVEADKDDLERELGDPGSQRIWYVGQAFREGMTLEQVHALTRIDPWFLVQIEDIVKTEKSLTGRSLKGIAAPELRELKKKGFADRRLAKLLGTDETSVRLHRHTVACANSHARPKRFATLLCISAPILRFWQTVAIALATTNRIMPKRRNSSRKIR